MSQERITEARVRASSVDNTEELLDDLPEPRAPDIVGKKRQRNQKDKSRPNGDLEIPTEIEEMWDSLTNTNPNPKPRVVIVDSAKSKEDDDEIDKLFNVRKRKSVWEKDRAEIALQVEQVMANLELAVEDDVELNKQGKPATNKLVKLPILVGSLSKKHLQADFLDHGVLNLLKNWLEPLPDGSLPNTNVRTSVLQILEDLSIILGRGGEGCRREQLIKSGLPKVVMFLSKSDEETRSNRRLANDLVNRWGHIIYERSTRYEEMLSIEEREEQEEVLSRREKKRKKRAAPPREAVVVGEFDVDVDFSAKPKPEPMGQSSTVVPTATSMEFVLRPRPKFDTRLKARAKMLVDGKRYHDLMKRVKRKRSLRGQSMHALKSILFKPTCWNHIPATLANLTSLKDFRVSDNLLNGSIPKFIGNWRQLRRLELYTSGLKGPVPDSIFRLQNLNDLRVSDITGGFGLVPQISSKNLQFLVLRNLNLSGPIPLNIWELPSRMTLNLSFNRLSGEIPTDTSAPKYTYLTGNMLSGDIEAGVFLTASTNIDLSYNNFTIWSQALP